jgi:signal transduction histidine kinase
LREAIRQYLTTVPTDIRTDVTVDGDLGEVSLAYSEELYLIIREAVRNAVHHGHPRSIRVQIRVRPDELFAEIRNDGPGFAVKLVLGSAHHVGLDSMRERADLLGADLKIKSSPRGGTTVTVTISLAGRPESEPPLR